MGADLNQNDYKSHSFRIGRATTTSSQGISESHIQIMDRWKSNAFMVYHGVSGYNCNS